MFDVAIYRKTTLGRAEIAERRLGIGPRLRSALIMVDGRTPFGKLRPLLAQIGDPKQLISQLSDLGLVESDHDLPPMPVFGRGLDEPTTLMELR
ncbi:MAG: hypothetical protein CGU28_04075 [Candidatus Dactylopiibacterium carminicum]|uniref:Uncharacterized protein n=1 Tax=Candidatus Dactylopiibacterium carminicum TaxID=857335 RepID=A0A272EXG8_9RHOO|nr:hypothetical protein [Candidatus Dactylopiibacterium carminicum]KAF7600182.1 hypothetical protein BGI27_03770 [Candidatus Dactylopiibacterium carminicum]PAS94799.1 MAG: hypothetical protein CGU29_02535 [Candidatus Dactylopiibacterium carminicum]PAS97723.1 MAG: hypothetical protein CGU28_04075 [Candidatus Dactylopiibacterium carminicum]PAT00183.1 MAG: hypothetical protein BSR46_03795 [Candidatus Dactylopiibacterium carminicum]